jgi:hypothetical protein
VTDTPLYRELAAYGLGLVDQHGWDLFSLTVDDSETWPKYDRQRPDDYRPLARGRVVIQLRDDYGPVRDVVLALAPGAASDVRPTYVNLIFSLDLGREQPVRVEVCANLPKPEAEPDGPRV